MEINLKEICRLCLNPVTDKNELFDLALSNEQSAIDFIRKLTGLKFLIEDSLPKCICLECTTSVMNAYNFAYQCIKSETQLQNEETRRILRKIEQEALSEEIDIKTEQIDSDCDDGLDNSDLFSDNDKLLEEIVIDIKNEKNKMIDKYKCKLCSETFTNKSKYLKHEKIHNDKPYKCEQCLQSFSKLGYLKVHLRGHTKDEDKKFTCKTCNKQFMFQYLLNQHEFKHKKEKPFPCTKCNKGCLTAESLRRHMKIHEENYTKKEHECSICFKIFPYPSYLAEHVKIHTGERPHLCSICGKGFRQTGALHFHQRTHTGYKPFKCKICNENFMSQSNLKVHYRKHTNERPFVCDKCGMCFRQSTDLKGHHRTHSGEKRVLCTICGKKFTTTGQLTVHIRTHTGEKPFSCTICLKAFTTRTMLVKHERIHTGERPYVCDICGKTFSQSSTLKSHVNTHYRIKKTKRSKKKVDTTNENGEASSKDIIRVNVLENNILNENAKETDKQSLEKIKTEFTVIMPAPVPVIKQTE